MKLIIIGSGIAGLASAVRLQAMGFEVTVLEANEYYGGKLTEFTQNGSPKFARFDPPWTPWFMRRNEIQIPIATPTQ